MKDIPDVGGIPGAYVGAYNRMMEGMEEDDARQEAMEEGRATMPLTEMNTTLGEEYIYQDAFKILMESGEWHALFLTDRMAAELRFSEVMESLCKAYDIKNGRS